MNLPANHLGGDRWYATDGIAYLGPVPFDSVVRELSTSRGQAFCYVRHEAWQIWRPLGDIMSLSRNQRLAEAKRLAQLSAPILSRVRAVKHTRHALFENKAVEELSDVDPPRTGVRPTMVDTVGVLSAADSLGSGLLITLCTSVMACLADVGLMHQVLEDQTALCTCGAQGRNSEALLGTQLTIDDAIVVAARSGRTLIAEPAPGKYARPMIDRIGLCLQNPSGCAMVPVVVDDRLIAIFELGRNRAFSAREIGRVEDVVLALVERAIFAGWFD